MAQFKKQVVAVLRAGAGHELDKVELGEPDEFGGYSIRAEIADAGWVFNVGDTITIEEHDIEVQ